MRGASTRIASTRRPPCPSLNSTGGTGKMPGPRSTANEPLARAVTMHHALRLHLDSAALVTNWRWLQRTAGVATGAAVKADGYGLGAREVVARLGQAGCRDFFVSTWAEAEALGA